MSILNTMAMASCSSAAGAQLWVAGNNGRMYYSANDGNTFTEITTHPAYAYIGTGFNWYAMAKSGGCIIAVGYGGGLQLVARTLDNGATWTAVNTGNAYNWALCTGNSVGFIIGTVSRYVMYSTDGTATTWTSSPYTQGLYGGGNQGSVMPTWLSASTTSNRIVLSGGNNSNNTSLPAIAYTDDNGVSWTAGSGMVCGNGMTNCWSHSYVNGRWYANYLNGHDSTYVGSYMYSTDGINFNYVASGGGGWTVTATSGYLASTGYYVVGPYYSADGLNFTSSTMPSGFGSVRSVIGTPNFVFALDNTGVVARTSNGTSWVNVNTSMTTGDYSSIFYL